MGRSNNTAAGGRKQPPQPASAKDDDITLQQDVAAFIKQLGFPANGVAGGDGFNDVDFQPQRAQQKIGTTTKADKKDASKATVPQRKATAAQPATKKAEAEARPPAAPTTPIQPTAAPAGAAPRSLLPKGASPIWHEAVAQLPPLPNANDAPPLAPLAADQLRVHAESLLQREAAAFSWQMEHGARGDLRWLQQARRSGTTQDRIAALTLLVTEHAMGNIGALDSLLHMAGKRAGGKQVIGTALDALQELFVDKLLPDRKLRFFEQQPLQGLPAGGALREQHLLAYAAEDAIKRRYAVFLGALEAASKDTIVWLKEKATKAMAALLQAKPEAESRLLASLVNKLGDPDRKVASKVCFLLRELLHVHPSMNLVVVREVEFFMFRPGLSEQARYYCIVFLNQMVLSHKDSEGGSALASKLLQVYFTLFKMLLAGRIGYAAEADKKRQDKAAAKGLDKKKRKGGGNKRAAKKDVPADNAAPSGQDAGPVQVTAMDGRMLSAILTGVRRAFPYVPAEAVEPLVQDHADTLFRIVHGPNLAVSVQAMLLLHTLMASQVSVSDRFYRALYALLLAPELPQSSKVAPMFLALLFKSVKADHSPQRVAAITKRLLQVAAAAPANFAAGALLITSELVKAHPVLSHCISHVQQGHGNDDDVERFADAADSADEADEDAALQEAAGVAVPPTEDKPTSLYDMHKREPLYANAAGEGLWELCCCMAHYHPSVAAWGRALLAGVPVDYAGDPLKDMGLAAFLDKFMLKKPKTKHEARGSSLMQPLPSTSASTRWVGSDAFASLTEDEVSPDALFFHKYFGLSAVQRKQEAKRRARAALDNEFEGDAAGEDDAEVDAFLAGEEDAGEEGISADPDAKGYDYSTLWQAMQGDDEDDAGSDADQSDDDDDDDSGEDVDMEDAMDDDEREGGVDDADDVPADLNAHALASESSGDSSDSDAHDTSEDEGEWVMATRLVGSKEQAATNNQEAATDEDEEASSDSQGEELDWLSEEDVDSDDGGGDVFAAAEEYDEAIAADLAGEEVPAGSLGAAAEGKGKGTQRGSKAGKQRPGKRRAPAVSRAGKKTRAM